MRTFTLLISIFVVSACAPQETSEDIVDPEPVPTEDGSEAVSTATARALLAKERRGAELRVGDVSGAGISEAAARVLEARQNAGETLTVGEAAAVERMIAEREAQPVRAPVVRRRPSRSTSPEAARWTQMAVGGNGLAMSALSDGYLYELYGLEEDLVLSYMWLRLSAALAGDEISVQQLDALIDWGLTVEDVQQGIALAQTCAATNFEDCPLP